jgi:hypothetical protein
MCNLIPTNPVPVLAQAHGADEKARTIRPWSHSVSMMFAHLAQALGLNEVRDGLHLKQGMFSTIRGEVDPIRG